MISSLLHLVGLRPRVYYTLTNFRGGGGKAPLAPPLNTPMCPSCYSCPSCDLCPSCHSCPSCDSCLPCHSCPPCYSCPSSDSCPSSFQLHAAPSSSLPQAVSEVLRTTKGTAFYVLTVAGEHGVTEAAQQSTTQGNEDSPGPKDNEGKEFDHDGKVTLESINILDNPPYSVRLLPPGVWKAKNGLYMENYGPHTHIFYYERAYFYSFMELDSPPSIIEKQQEFTIFLSIP